MELLKYNKTQFYKPLSEVAKEISDYIINPTNKIRKIIQDRLCKNIWTKQNELTCIGYGLAKWVSSYFNDYYIHKQLLNCEFDNILVKQSEYENLFKKTINNSRGLNINPPPDPIIEIRNLHQKLNTIFLRELKTTNFTEDPRKTIYEKAKNKILDISLFSGDRIFEDIINYTFNTLQKWIVQRGIELENPRNDEKKDFLEYISEETTRILILSKVLKILLNPPPNSRDLDFLIKTLLGLIFIRFTPCFNGMYYHYVYSNVVSREIKVYFRENVEIPYKMGTVGYLPDVTEDALVLKRLFSDLRGIMSPGDSALGNRSWIGYPVYDKFEAKEGAKKIDIFIGIVIINFPIDCILSKESGLTNKVDEPGKKIAKKLKKIVTDKLEGKEEKEHDVYSKEYTTLSEEIKKKSEKESTNWSLLFKKLIPSDLVGVKQRDFFGFSMATAWKKENAHLVLKTASVLSTTLAHNFEPRNSRIAAVLPLWRSCAEERMEEYIKIIQKDSISNRKKYIRWDYKEENGLMNQIWDKVEKKKTRGIIGQNLQVEETHNTFHHWADKDAEFRVFDLVIPILCPVRDPSRQEKCQFCPINIAIKNSHNYKSHVVAFLRINFFKVGSKIELSKRMEELKNIIIGCHEDLSHLITPICLHRQIKRERLGTIQDILVEDFEDSWFSLICRFLLNVENTDEKLVANLAANSFDTCIAFSGGLDKYESEFWHEGKDIEPIISSVINKLKRVRRNLEKFIGEKDESILAMSIWNRRMRFRLKDIPKWGDKKEKELDLKKNHPILDEVENRILGKAISIVSRWQDNSAPPIEIHPISTVFKDASDKGNIVHFNTRLGRKTTTTILSSPNRKPRRFNYMYIDPTKNNREKKVFFSNKKDLDNNSYSKNDLVSYWKEDIYLENAEWVCAYKNIGKFLFAGKIEREILYNYSNITEHIKKIKNVNKYLCYIPANWKEDYNQYIVPQIDGLKFPTELKLIEGELFPTGFLCIMPIMVENRLRGVLHLFSSFKPPFQKYGYSNPLEIPEKNEKLHTLLNKFADYVKDTYPERAEEIKSKIKNITPYDKKCFDESYDNLSNSADNLGISGPLLAKVLELCFKAYVDNVENQSLSGNIVVIAQKEIRNPDKANEDLLNKLRNIGASELLSLDTDINNHAQIIMAMRILKKHPKSFLVVNREGKINKAWEVEDVGEPKVWEVKQTYYKKEIWLGERLEGMVFSLPGNDTLKVFANGTQISELRRKGWIKRNINNFIQRAKKINYGDLIEENDYKILLSAAMWSSDNNLGLAFLIGKKEMLDQIYDSDSGYDPKDITNENKIEKIDHEFIAGLGWTDGAVIINDGGLIVKYGANLTPRKFPYSIPKEYETDWGKRHIYTVNAACQINGIAIVVSVTGRITIFDPRQKNGLICCE